MANANGTAALKRGAFALLTTCAMIASLAASIPASHARAATGIGEAVPGEILVRFAPNVATEARARARDRAGVRVKRNLLLPRLQLVRTLPGTPVSAALGALNADPSVRYAEPNWLYRLQSAPNDPRFGEQWNLRNTGQTIQSVAGIPGADISAPGAWNIATGSRAVKIAVLDTGVDYFHPDLAANMWRNPGEAVAGEQRNGLDDDHNGFVDDLGGWDFFSNDADPLDPSGHGTAVASIAGAVGDNGLGIVGINWSGSLIALRVCGTGAAGCPADAIADAATYAGRIGADVANMSFGGSSYSQAEREAIAAAPDTLFVAAAGNGSTDIDASPFYPCALDLANVVCVTATDNHDGQVFNYGASSVDLGAPGVNVLTASVVYRERLSDDFDGVVPLWDYTQAPAPAVSSRWRRVLWTGSGSLTDSTNYKLGLEDSESGNYANNADTRVTLSSPVDLSGQHGCFLSFETALKTEPSKDYLRVEAATSLAGPFSELTRVSGSTQSAQSSFAPVVASLARFEGGSVYLRLRLTSDGANTADGAHVDNFKVRCEDPVDSYGFETGTSGAAPHVAGAAALVKSHMPSLSVAELRAQILSSVDPLPSLSGKTVTGGRLNVARALTPLDTTPPDTAAPNTLIDSGPQDASTTKATAASFAFSATEPGSTFECKLDSADYEPCTSPKAYSGLADGAHTFSVRATDPAGNTGGAAQASWAVDTSPPVVTITNGPDGSTSSPQASFAFVSSEYEAFACSLDGSSYVPCSSPVSYDGLADGPHSFTVRAGDAAGNWGAAATRDWSVELLLAQPPALDPPELGLAIQAQTIPQVLRHGLLSVARVRAECPCRLQLALQLNAKPAKTSGRRAAVTSRDTLTVPAQGQVRTRVDLSKAASARLRKASALGGWLEAKLSDRYDRAALVQKRVSLRR
ncbi:MAG: hypothetical protein QOJ38_1592 [Solirubrobacterales bacterium]|nr:hypothetical protein [Solirubrobacterales bacterium]